MPSLFARWVMVSVMSVAWYGVAPAFAEELDAASNEALMKTQELLTTGKLREHAISENKDAQLVDQQIRSLVGDGVDREMVFTISSQIFADLVKSSNGDPKVMSKFLLKAKDDPKAFFENLSDRDKKMIQELSEKTANPPSARP